MSEDHKELREWLLDTNYRTRPGEWVKEALTKLLAENERLKDLVQTPSQQGEILSGHLDSERAE